MRRTSRALRWSWLACLALGACKPEPATAPDAEPAAREAAHPASTAEATLTPAVQAFNSVSLPRVADLFTEDHELWLPVAGMEPVRGREGLLALLRSVQLAFPDAQLKLRRVLDGGAEWACELAFSGTHQAEFLGVPATQKRVECHFALYGQVRGGRLTRTNVVGNALALLKQLKGDPERMPPGPTVPERPAVAVGPGTADQVGRVRALYVAFDAGDGQALASLVTEDVNVLALGDGKILRGVTELRDALVKERKAFEGKVRVERAFAAGACVAVLLQVEGKIIGTTGPYTASGKPFQELGIDVFELRGDRIASWSNYRNVLDVLTQLGLYPPPAPDAPSR